MEGVAGGANGIRRFRRRGAGSLAVLLGVRFNGW